MPNFFNKNKPNLTLYICGNYLKQYCPTCLGNFKSWHTVTSHIYELPFTCTQTCAWYVTV